MAAGKTKEFPEVWLGLRCKICGYKLSGRQKSYCGESCRKAGNIQLHRDYYRKNKDKWKAYKKKQKPVAALRVPCQGQQDHPGCSAAGQPSVSDLGPSSPPPFPEKKTRAGGTLTTSKNPMYCEKYKQIITADICAKRQDRITTRGDFIDVFCRHTCMGEMLRPATRAELRVQRNLIRRVSREKGLEVMSA